jgi:hypothetical protein
MGGNSVGGGAEDSRPLQVRTAVGWWSVGFETGVQQ